MTRTHTLRWQWLTALLLLVLLAPLPAQADHTPDPIGVAIVGSLQSELGCRTDWDPACTASELVFDANDDLWQATFSLPAGNYEYKAALNDGWDENYGANAAPGGANIPLNLTAPTTVKFYYSHDTHWITDDVTATIAGVTGSFQSELGCSGDWDPTCLRGWLQDPDGDGTFTFATTAIPAGSYEAKVTLNEDWGVNYGAGGAQNGANIGFAVPADAETTFSWNFASKVLTITTAAPPPPPPAWVVAGDFQSEVGCPGGDWDEECADTGMYDDNADGVFKYTATVPAGGFQYKVVQNGNWNFAYPAANVPFTGGDEVRWYFQPGPNRVADSVNQCIATVAGSFQSEVGGDNWSPDNLRTMLWQEAPGSDWYQLVVNLPAGEYQYKVARNELFGVSFPESNVTLTVPTDTAVTFRYNCATNEVLHTVSGGGGASHDNDIWWNDLGHNSRDSLFRTPGGPVVTNTAVTLRLRAASGDLTAAKLRIWNDRTNAQSLLDMTLVADDGSYEYWEATVSNAEPTLFYYRFIAYDGTATAYYEDDATRDGGWGQTFGGSPDNSFQLTIYDPAYSTPDFVKNGIMYQIFTDRFRNGDPSNDPQPGRFFYDELDGTIYRSDPTGGTTNDWNTVICDPREVGPCTGTYSLNFYGGDLQGVIDQLDYLDDLGVTILYFNPIFASPSNHKYDTTDFGVISEDFGDLATFEALVTAANNRGMSIVLDGVFNHTSSDSIYFDRYSRFDAAGNETSAGPGANDGSGACESHLSPYRDWYYFTDVPAGTGPCVGSDGTPGGADYESWFGFDSLPKLQAGSPDVRDYIYAGGPDAIALYWLAEGAEGWRFDVGGDIDPGLTNDPTNDYWEQFRTTTRALNPDAYMVLEEWGNSSAWMLGNEMDATMNYQYSSAMLSFWRDTTFVDNDHNSGSSAGELVPLTPSQLDGRLNNWIERYPPEAMYAMMNLLGSHDTNRALFMLDENAANGTDVTPLLNPTYDWSDALTRLQGVVLLQMTLPGAPQIYYGDEVGLVGPTYYHGGKWEDDPYNRQPYPWLDETGTPFYTHLQAGGYGQTTLLSYYQTLTTARNNHPALRTGSFDTLLVDDTANTYAYGRLLADYSDAAVVVINRAGAAQSITVDVSGYLPIGASFTNVLTGTGYTVNASGELVLASVPGMGGALLVANGPLSAAPATVTDLAVTAVDNTSATLGWSGVIGADSYAVYRSALSGGGYSYLGSTASTTYTDTGLTTAESYFYVVVAVNTTTGLESGDSNEVSATPAYVIGWANLQWPPTLTHTISTTTRTVDVYGQIWIDGVTSVPGATPGLLAQVGYGPGPAIDGNWVWEPMTFNVDAGNNEEYMGSLLPEAVGVFCYTTRYSGDGGATWFYAANGPADGNPTCPGPFGVLTVNPSADTTAPASPTNLTLTGSTASSILLAWDAHPNADGDLEGFELYRDGVRVAVLGETTTSYSDSAVSTGATYAYYLVAYDTSFNRSAPSNTVNATAEARPVTVTFRVGVPVGTPGTVHIVGDIPQFGPWNPGLVPMTQVDATTWEYTLDLEDGTALQYKFTRGSWETVEWWGSITDLNNRAVTIDYGTTGTQLVDLTATDWGTGADDTKAVQAWRDPYVTAFTPADGSTDLPTDTVVTVTWSMPVNAPYDFAVTGPDGAVAGTFAYDAATLTTTFTPDAPLARGATYDVAVSGQSADSGGQQVSTVFSFSTLPLTPSEMLDALQQKVEDYYANGDLRRADYFVLRAHLKHAERFIDSRPHITLNSLRLAYLHVYLGVRFDRISTTVGQDLMVSLRDLLVALR